MESSESETESLNPAFKETQLEHDRIYQSYSIRQGVYCVPVDEDEEIRLEKQHEMIRMVIGDKLFLADVYDPVRVLDCGYGRAQWIFAVAQQYENCRVDGIDIYPLELPEEFDNIFRFCDDLNQSLTDIFELDTYDVINSRFVAPGIHKNRWPSYVMELSRLLKKGGTLQMMEFYYNFQSQTGQLDKTNALYQWGENYRTAVSRDRDPRIGSSDPRNGGKTQLRMLFEVAQLVEINEQIELIPVGDWPSDERQKKVGILNLANIDRLLDSLGTWVFVNRLGLTRDQVNILNDQVCPNGRVSFSTYQQTIEPWSMASEHCHPKPFYKFHPLVGCILPILQTTNYRAIQAGYNTFKRLGCELNASMEARRSPSKLTWAVLYIVGSFASYL